MKRNLILVVLIFTAISCFSQSLMPALIPMPKEIKMYSGMFVIKQGVNVSYSNEQALFVANYLVQKLNNSNSINMKAKLGAKELIQLTILSTEDVALGNEGYLMDINEQGISIKANTYNGLYYGVQTLLQLCPSAIEQPNNKLSNIQIPALSIKDSPAFAWRGVMLDVSRHFFTKEEIKHYIDQLSRYKINVFHWHLTDDHGWRLEIKSLPRLTEVGAWRVQRYGAFGKDRKAPMPNEKATYGGFYTHDDVREIVKYAQDRGVTIIPEIDVPGHSMAAIAAYPELSCTKDTSIRVSPGHHFSNWFGGSMFRMLVDNTLNPSDSNVYKFLDKVFTEVAMLFPSEYIHVGGDECYKGYWKTDSNCKKLMKEIGTRHVEDLQGYFMNRVNEIVKSKGKKIIGWDEVLEGGISSDATIMFWRGWLGNEIVNEALTNGNKVIMSPTKSCYLDYYQGAITVEPPVYARLTLQDIYDFKVVPEGLAKESILGGQANLWTEAVPNIRHAEYMTFPRVWALSQVLWSDKNDEWFVFAERVIQHFERAEFSNVNFSTALFEPLVNFKKIGGKRYIEFVAQLPNVDIYYTYDDSMPSNKYSLKYNKPIEIPEGAVSYRIQAYRNGVELGKMITLSSDFLNKNFNW